MKAIVRLSLPDDRPIDGLDIMPVLTSGAPSPHEALLAMSGPKLTTVISARWKLHVMAPSLWPRNVINTADWIDPRGPDGATIIAPHEQPTPLEHPFDEAWLALINTNLQAPLLMSQALYGSLKAESGCIINLLDAHTAHPQRGYALYDLSKNGLVSLTRSLALEMAPEVRVNGVAPGAILLPVGEQLPSGAANAAEFTQKIPLQRLGQETDIAAAVTFLVTAAPYITGQVLAVDGGRNLLG